MRTLSLFPLVSILSSAMACYGAGESPDSAAASGKVLASALGCTGCHGPDLSGGSGPNLSPDIATGLGAWSDAQITAAIRTGVDDEGNALCPSMPRFSALDDEQVGSLVAFLRSLPAKSNTVPPAQCGIPDVPSDAGLEDAGVVIVTDDANTTGSTCDGYADPNTVAACHACKVAPCQANGCFGGYYCELVENWCVPKPPGC